MGSKEGPVVHGKVGLLTDHGYDQFKSLLLELGAVVTPMPIDEFIATVEKLESMSDEIMELDKRKKAKSNLDIFRRAAKALKPFQDECRKIAAEVEEEDGSTSIILPFKQ